ncbi:hypothetical protein ADUPG1_012190 [Aduncisulcus paluster]|uniref:Uncharacterized protein n=1 Tax=Aduncisulcus paluster TaxID=2918883 RepID=A0ABQ5JYL8_9EUKA|nr:hypothetical protein ADUPG1_012190 [Aduncisulcus paluster]
MAYSLSDLTMCPSSRSWSSVSLVTFMRGGERNLVFAFSGISCSFTRLIAYGFNFDPFGGRLGLNTSLNSSIMGIISSLNSSPMSIFVSSSSTFATLAIYSCGTVISSLKDCSDFKTEFEYYNLKGGTRNADDCVTGEALDVWRLRTHLRKPSNIMAFIDDFLRAKSSADFWVKEPFTPEGLMKFPGKFERVLEQARATDIQRAEALHIFLSKMSVDSIKSAVRAGIRIGSIKDIAHALDVALEALSKIKVQYTQDKAIVVHENLKTETKHVITAQRRDTQQANAGKRRGTKRGRKDPRLGEWDCQALNLLKEYKKERSSALTSDDPKMSKVTTGDDLP